MKHIGRETHVEAFIYDPFPTVDRYRADTMSDDYIMVEAKSKYGTDLMAVAIYEVEVIEHDGITYRSEPLNQRRTAIDMETK